MYLLEYEMTFPNLAVSQESRYHLNAKVTNGTQFINLT